MRTGNKERGQALLMTTLSIMTMFGLLGLAIDIGLARFKKETAQAAAEAAAMAAVQAAMQIGNYTCDQNGLACLAQPTPCPTPIPNPPTTNIETGCLYAQQNGFVVNGSGGKQNVTMQSGISSPAPTVPGVQVQYWVTARVSERMPQLFSAVLGNPTAGPAARATAAVIGVNSLDSCVYVLDASAEEAFDVEGGTVKTCGIRVNSSSSEAMQVEDETCLISTGSIKIAGGYEAEGCGINPTPITGAPAVADPLKNLQAPVYSGCNHTYTQISKSSATLNPGVYCGGISITDGANVTFNPGVYIILGGGMTIHESTVSGSGVSFYNTANSSYEAGGIDIEENVKVSLSAPSSGTMQGVLFFEDRTHFSSGEDDEGDDQENVITVNSTDLIQGTLYFPTASLEYAGGSGLQNPGTTIIANTLKIDGSSTLMGGYTNPQGTSAPTVSLIE